MRITNELLFGRIAEISNRSRAESTRLQQQIASGKRVTKPSDDPFAFNDAKLVQQEIRKNQQFLGNINEGLLQARSAQQQLEVVSDQMFRLKTLATKGANEGVVSQDEFDILAQEVAGIRENIVDSLNANEQGRFLFAGTATLTKPFELSGSTVIYNGNSENISVPISDQRQIEVSVSGDELNSVFTMLTDLENALQAGDADAVRAQLPAIDSSLKQVTQKASDIGRSIQFMELSIEQLEQTNILNSSELSELTDADLIDAAARLQQQQFSQQAALSANARIIQTSLLNFI